MATAATARMANGPPGSANTAAIASPPGGAGPEAFRASREAVRSFLMAVPNFTGLSDQERKDLAMATVKVLTFMADPNGVYSEVAEREARGELPRGTLPAELGVNSEPAPPARAKPIAAAMADPDPVEATKKQLSRSPGFAGKDFQAGAVQQGVEQFGEMVQKVDFPKFVGGLIKNVFQAIVESSIEQMRAFGELIANVAKTTDEFMRDNIGESAGRDFLASSFPDALSVEVSGSDQGFDADAGEAPAPQAKLVANGEDAAVRLAEISRNLNLSPPVTDITDANAELRLVTAARLQMAKSRQQLLSSMVMLGINRIVVTDGSINAKVIFDMRASDKAQRKYTASMNDRSAQSYKESMKQEFSSWYSPFSASAAFEGSQEHVATVASAVDESSESKAEVKAKLSGEVRVNFKSDYLPLDKMATPEMMSVIQGNSTPYNPNSAARPAAGAGAGTGR